MAPAGAPGGCPGVSRRRVTAGRRRALWPWQLGLIALLALAALVVWTDIQVRTRMQGRLWSLPAQVYARPLELYAGAQLSRERVVAELRLLGFREVAAVEAPGQYRERAGELVLHSRAFMFGDEREPARLARLRFADDMLSSLRDGQGRPLPLLRLAPLEIGRIYPGDNEDRLLVALEDVPGHLVQALLSIEDRQFFEHPGIDPRGVLRAAWRNLQAGRIREGGSTLTQQLVKNLFVGSERSLRRKLHEALIALVLEFRYTKAQILEAYLNEIYLGQQGARAIHGVGRAARFYFARPLAELSLSEAALIAALARGASLYDPRRFPERARARRDTVLSGMEELGLIDAGQAAAARAEPLGVVARGRAGQAHPAFFDLVRRQLARHYPAEALQAQGLQIFTTLDPLMQAAAEQAVEDGTRALESRSGVDAGLQAALVVTAPGTGEVLALVGDRDPRFPGFNRALDAQRPIGSLVKPFLYLSALASGRYSVSSRIEDSSIDLRDQDGRRWQPRNYDGRAHGPVTLEQALANSYNLAAVRLGMDLGIPAVQRSLRAAGLQGEIPPYPSLMLGTLEASPLELAQAYGAIANGGAVLPPRAIREVLTRDSRALTRYGLRVRQSLDPRPAFLTTWLMSRVVAEGTARSLGRSGPRWLPLAGKTGTTDDLRDSWYAGFGEDYLAVAWLGRDDNGPAGLTGAGGALEIWTRLARTRPPHPLRLQPPAGVEWAWVGDAGEARPGPQCSGARKRPFLTGTVPPAQPGCGPATPGAVGAPPPAAARSTPGFAPGRARP